MLDKQVSLFKLDTNAFLHIEEKSKREELYLKFQREDKNDLRVKEGKKKYKEYLLEHAAECVKYNDEHEEKRLRQLDESYLRLPDGKTNLQNVIAMFESTLTRSFGIKTDELTTDIFIVEIYYYDIAQDIIVNGFEYNKEKYVYFSSSAGQIRTKKAVFVNEKKYEQCKLKLGCGITVDDINAKGGMNVNKYLAYLALANSATEIWDDVFGKPFDIDRSIIVDDFETLVHAKVDNIDYETYEITPDVEMDIPIPHTDGCGLIDRNYCTKNFMVRLPWVKGLLGSFDFRRFIVENNCSPIVKDIWGKEYDIFKDDIQIIFTKSQHKLWKFYQSWEEYKDDFKKYNCEACVCNLEEDKIPNAHINYQMLQTLYKATDEDIAEMCYVPNEKIKRISDSVKNALGFYGVQEENDLADPFQKALRIYPELINDPASKQDLKDLRNSYVKKYRGGKLDVIGKFTFVLPDLYAFCQWLFMGMETPSGLLADQEVYCQLYRNNKELDCLRSPHLYVEHAIRNNVCDKEIDGIRLQDWFQTDAVYTSTFDAISRILQFDELIRHVTGKPVNENHVNSGNVLLCKKNPERSLAAS